ncbi:NEW3 domain-containing protein [Candidatus Latescibacterota bacterium]
MATFLAILIAAAHLSAPVGAKDLRTKEQRLYEIALRSAQWQVDSKRLDMLRTEREYDAIQDLYNQNIETLDELNRAKREYQQSKLFYGEATTELERTRLNFLRDATHISIVEAKKYRTASGRRQVDIVFLNGSNLDQAMSLNPERSSDEVAALLEIQNIGLSLQDGFGLIVAEPYDTLVASLKLGQRDTLTFRLLDDYEDVVVAMSLQEARPEELHIVLRRESLQDIPTVNSVQFSQEGDLNTRVRFDLILERLAEDEKTFRLALVNLPREINPAFIDPSSNASLTQVKFSEEMTRQQLELELQIPEKLSRHYVDRTIEFYVFVTDAEGFKQIGELNRQNRDGPIPIEEINQIIGEKERFELIPRGQGALETIIANRYQEIKTGEEVVVRVDLLNTGTLEVEKAHLVLTPPLDWTYTTQPETIATILPGEKEPINITLVPPSGLGVSEYDVRVEAAGYEGSERIEAQEKDITIRVEERADVIRNALIIGAVIALVVGVAVGSIKVSRR